MFLEHVQRHCSLYALYDITGCPKIQFMPSTKLSSSPRWRMPHQPGGDSQNRGRIESFLRCSVSFNYQTVAAQLFNSICAFADDKLFSNILHYNQHILFPLLPPVPDTHYPLQVRSHNLQLPTCNWMNLMHGEKTTRAEGEQDWLIDWLFISTLTLGMCRTPVQPVLSAGNDNTGFIGTGRYLGCRYRYFFYYFFFLTHSFSITYSPIVKIQIASCLFDSNCLKYICICNAALPPVYLVKGLSGHLLKKKYRYRYRNRPYQY